MKKPQRYTILWHDGGVIENEEGEIIYSADFDKYEESRKLTIEELQAQFEKLFCGKFSKYENGNYILDATRTAWEAYLFCAMNNNLLKGR